MGLSYNDISIIVAVDKFNGFAKNHKIPWHYPEDMAFFRDKTKGKNCLMGKNTYAEINNKTNNSTNVLPGRNCFVLSSSLQHVTNATVIRDITEVDLTNMYVIGGKRLFDHFLPHASTVYVTHIDKSFACDTFFDVKALAANFMRVDQHRTGDLTFAMYRNKEFLFG